MTKVDPVLEVEGLWYAYSGGPWALNGLALRIPRGGKIAILGANGTGKTTLLLHLNGTLRPSAGTIWRDGVPVRYGARALLAWRAAVGLVLQDPDDQLFAATVAEDVSFGPLNLGLDAVTVQNRVAAALAAMRITDLADRPPHCLSFGQRKRVAIAGLLAMKPHVLLLDEPTTGLDGWGVIHLLAVLDRLVVKHGTTIVLTTHDVDLAYAWADEVALLRGGCALIQGRAVDVLGDQTLLQAARLRQPWMAALGLTARQLGLLGADDSLPRSRTQAIKLLKMVADWKEGSRLQEG
ncbi:ATPase component CbiO of energizing module of cobalt ECF transporter [invertebrate metagenome]|uniref:ATPase component CbiO of energizing module of cobalt ECF transporter n=1 Tax=invertebrate metagenome TaxID=1711999 RepID=A0A484H4S3_9ZZZZ